MSSYRPIDSKREEFRKYLEKAGALDALTKVLVMLYDEPEKPADALDYIRRQLGDDRPDEAEFESLKTDLEAATLKIQTLEDEITVLKERLAQYEPKEKGADEAGSKAGPDGNEALDNPLSESAEGQVAPAEEAEAAQ